LLNIILKILSVFIIVAVLVTGAGPAGAQNLSLIRDAEIENTIRQFAAPIFRAADLDPSIVKIHLVKDNSINAFVAGGQRVFVFTGLITNASSAGQIIGVIAHETGHISGGHLARIHDELKKASATTILSMLIGAVAIGAGRGDVAGIALLAGQGLAQSNFLKYSRTQEAAADQAGLRYLDKTKLSAKGFLDFMNLLGEQELLLTDNQDPYVRTHPLTRRRVENIAQHVSNSPYSNNPIPEELEKAYRRAKAKLYGYLNPIGHTVRVYKESDNSLESRYARAIGHYRKGDLAKALPLVNGLIAENPRDPYFWELKGQMLFENGDAKAALKPYQAAVDFLPDNGLLRVGLARVQLALNDPELLDPAIKNLGVAVTDERNSSFIWRELAIAYARKGDKGRSSLALAEAAMLNGKKSEARFHAGRAERLFPRGSREWLQAQDILLAAEVKKK